MILLHRFLSAGSCTPLLAGGAAAFRQAWPGKQPVEVLRLRHVCVATGRAKAPLACKARYSAGCQEGRTSPLRADVLAINKLYICVHVRHHILLANLWPTFRNCAISEEEEKVRGLRLDGEQKRKEEDLKRTYSLLHSSALNICRLSQYLLHF